MFPSFMIYLLHKFPRLLWVLIILDKTRECLFVFPKMNLWLNEHSSVYPHYILGHGNQLPVQCSSETMKEKAWRTGTSDISPLWDKDLLKELNTIIGAICGKRPSQYMRRSQIKALLMVFGNWVLEQLKYIFGSWE